MEIIDLTLPINKIKTTFHKVPLDLPEGTFTGITYNFSHHSMEGTYIDFPGHIAETDSCIDSENYPIVDLYRIPAMVIHLDRGDGTGAVTAKELMAAINCNIDIENSAVIINALGKKRFDEITERSVYLSADAADWLISRGIRLIVSDIYESNDNPQGVFLKFFNAGISTICSPINLDKLPYSVKLTVMFSRIKNITQLPCRIIAEKD